MNYASIDSVLLKNPHLRLVDGDLYGISRRIKEISKGYFIVFNTRTEHYEAHCTENLGWDTHCLTIPYPRLDYRTLQLARETNVRLHGDRILKQLEEHNAKLTARNEKDFHNYLNDAGLETADMTSLAIDKDDLHDGYQRTHCMGGGVENDCGRNQGCGAADKRNPDQ